MKTLKSTRGETGFTLVEIAVVLVIIGLLLGGILRGQELIKSARVRSLANQISGIQAAYFGFVDRYQRQPGDWQLRGAALAIPGVANGGNGDGRIAGGDAGPWDEALAVWEHLSRAEFIQGAYRGGTGQPSADALGLAPRNAFGGLMFLFEVAGYGHDEGTPPARLGLSLGTNIPVEILAELDLKLDDGLPLTGALRQAPTQGAALAPFGVSHPDCVDRTAVPAVYNITGRHQNCAGVYLF